MTKLIISLVILLFTGFPTLTNKIQMYLENFSVNNLFQVRFNEFVCSSMTVHYVYVQDGRLQKAVQPGYF